MVNGIIGRKVGMTQVFAADGTVTPATVVKAGPCVVLQAKNAQSDGYEAVQLGLVEEKPAKVNKALDKAEAMISLQGAKMGRPSHIHISIATGLAGDIHGVRVGGEAVLAGEGTLYV